MALNSELLLLYFEGCPNFSVLKSILENEGIRHFREVDLESLPEEDPLRNYTSPTLLLGNETLIGEKLSGDVRSCSYWTREEMVAVIQREKSRF